MNDKSDLRICPLCGEDNGCQNIGCGSEGEQDCWCKGEKFPAELLEMVPAEDRAQACICQLCLEAYRGNG